MKLLSRVVWSEGMYLSPQHFQAQNRYFEDSVRFAIEHAWFEPWGLSSYELDHSAIANGRVRLISAKGIFRYGLTFDLNANCDLPVPPNIQEIFPSGGDSLDILLAVPEWQEQQPNCASEGNSGNMRYQAGELSVRDLNTGTDEKKIKICKKNIAILTQNEIGDGWLTIPLARIKRNEAGSFSYDGSFVPPCTKIKASPWLKEFLRQLIEVLKVKRTTVTLPRNRAGGFSQLEILKFWFLHTINDALATFQHLHNKKDGHPEELFREMSRIAGALCTFKLASDPAQLPKYNHCELYRCFQALGKHIREHLDVMVPENTITVPIRPSPPNYYFGDITDQACFVRSRWILGIGSPAGEADVMTKTPYLVKVCSGEFIEKLVQRAMPGLALSHLPVPPSAISAKLELQYFSINKSGPCWTHICDTRQVGIYVPNDLTNATVELEVILES